MIITIILAAILSAFFVFMLGTTEPGKDGRPIKTRKKVEVYLILLSVVLGIIAYVYLKLFSDGLL